MSYSVFNAENKSDTIKRKMFLDDSGPVSIARFDLQKYPTYDKLVEKQLGFFWQPTEIDVSKDAKDFKDLSKHEEHIFTSNLKRQILLDSVQGRSPALALLPLTSLPEVENWIETWTFNETIHSRSYTHLIRNVYPNPSVVFDTIMDTREIMDCATDISKYYDKLIKASFKYLNGDKHSDEEKYNIKKLIWLTLQSINALEGVRFYVSFACSWAFAELKKMEGNAKIIKLICRDENLHLASTQTMLKHLLKDDEDFAKISEETKEESHKLFIDVVEQEKAWADYLFKDGSIIGLNNVLLKDYVEWIAHKRMSAIGLDSPYQGGSNPLPWTEKWISGGDVQVAPQETEITSYIIGGIEKDVTKETFKGFKL